MQKGASEMKIIPIIYARSVLPECMVFYGGSRERTVTSKKHPIGCFLFWSCLP